MVWALPRWHFGERENPRYRIIIAALIRALLLNVLVVLVESSHSHVLTPVNDITLLMRTE